MDVQELRPGLWRWTARHPEWDDREVGSAYVETADAVVLVDPLVPRDEEERFYRALDRDVERLDLPVAIVLTNPWHRRSSAELAARFGATVHAAGQDLPTGFEAYPGGMQPEDFVVFAPSHGVLFTGDTIVDGRPCPEGLARGGTRASSRLPAAPARARCRSRGAVARRAVSARAAQAHAAVELVIARALRPRVRRHTHGLGRRSAARTP